MLLGFSPRVLKRDRNPLTTRSKQPTASSLPSPAPRATIARSSSALRRPYRPASRTTASTAPPPRSRHSVSRERTPRVRWRPPSRVRLAHATYAKFVDDPRIAVHGPVVVLAFMRDDR